MMAAVIPRQPAACVLPALLAAALPSSSAASTVPADFEDALVVHVSAPTAIAFTPDGRMLITQQTGTLRVFHEGTLGSALSLSVCSNSERGLLGVAVDPDFSENRYIYLYYTRPGVVTA
jgi:glucose/arabinose dehydrogenase